MLKGQRNKMQGTPKAHLGQFGQENNATGFHFSELSAGQMHFLHFYGEEVRKGKNLGGYSPFPYPRGGAVA